MTTTRLPIRNLIPAYIVLLGTNIAGGLLLLPIFVQLLLNTCACVYIGCMFSTRLSNNADGTVNNFNKSLEQDQAVISMQEAKRFPIVASVCLFGLYCLYKVVPKDVFMGILNTYFSFAIVLSISSIATQVIPFPQQMQKIIGSWKIPGILQQLLQCKKFELSKARVVCLILASIPVSMYFATKNWALNNIFAVLFSIVALKTISLSTTKTGLFLLWALFFYDIFWVYGTDVMVTVAKNVDLPIKISFPYQTYQTVSQTVSQSVSQTVSQIVTKTVAYSMVGLGDIVLPGFFISFCLKYDIDQAFKKNPIIKSFSDIELPYFNFAFIGYALGIVETFFTMYIFDHPQPALLFLVPMCTIPVLLKSFFRGQFMQYLNYDTELIMKEQADKQKQLANKQVESTDRQIEKKRD